MVGEGGASEETRCGAKVSWGRERRPEHVSEMRKEASRLEWVEWWPFPPERAHPECMTGAIMGKRVLVDTTKEL